MGEHTSGCDVVMSRLHSGQLEVLVAGELDIATAPDLLDGVVAELRREPADVVVVLTDVTFIDSTGAVTLLEIDGAARSAGRRCRLSAPSEAVRQVLDLTGLLPRFEVDG